MELVAYVKKMANPLRPFWNWIYIGLCVSAISLDPLFFYIPVVNDDKKCIGFDKKLGIVAVVLRSCSDFFHMFYILFQLRPQAFAVDDFRASNRRRNTLYHHYPRKTARKYLMRFFPIDLLSILPLPQLIIITMIRGSKHPKALELLKFFVIFQYVPRTIRIFPLITKARMDGGLIAEGALVKASFNLFLYMLASHVFGALWYFFAIERETACWRKACINYTGCGHASFYCDDNLRDYQFLDHFCSTKTQNMTYDFGIYNDLIQTGIVETVDFLPRFLHCFRWGLQNLSCFGQNLQTSGSAGENFFAILITISGLVLFLFLIGNMQIYLQSKTLRSEEMRLKAQEIEQWPFLQKLPEFLQRQVKKYQRYVWQENKGIDVENFLNSIPKGLKKTIVRSLCLDTLKRVPVFAKMDEQLFDAICNRLKPVLHTDESYIVREGEPVDEMLFLMQGNLLSTTGGGRVPSFLQTCNLKAGDYIGNELIPWALDPQSSFKDLPISTRTVKALTEVEAFVLMADDWRFVATQLRRLHSERLRHAFRFYSIPWRTWAATYIQVAWHRYTKKKLEESLRAEEYRLQNELAKPGGIAPNLGVTIYATRFSANILRARRRNGKAEMLERVPAMLLQKPDEPDVSDEEPHR